MVEEMEIDANTSQQARPRQLPTTPSPAALGIQRTMAFLNSATASQPKTRRQEIARELVKLEAERKRAYERIKKRKQRIRVMIAEQTADETRRAEIDVKVAALKSEIVE